MLRLILEKAAKTVISQGCSGTNQPDVWGKQRSVLLSIGSRNIRWVKSLNKSEILKPTKFPKTDKVELHYVGRRRTGKQQPRNKQKS